MFSLEAMYLLYSVKMGNVKTVSGKCLFTTALSL